MAGENENTGAPGTGEQLTQETVIPDGGQPGIEEILKFDPFAPPKAPEGTKPAGQGTEEKPPAKPGAAPAAKPAVGADGKPVVSAPAKTPEQLIAEHTASIREMLNRAPQPAAAKPVEPKAPEAPKFNLGIPDQLLNAMSSEDPKERSLATHALVNGVANAVWRETQALMQQQVTDLIAGWPRVIEAHLAAREQQQNIHNDFYGTYKQFTGKQWIPLVQAHAAQIMNEMAAAGQQITGWTPEMRDEIANRLFAEFPQLKDWKEPPAKPNGGAPPKKNQFATGGGGGTRPATEAGPVSDMLAVLGQKPN